MASVSEMSENYGKVSAYSAPDWTEDLKSVPEKRVKLSMRPTPIHKWNPPHVPNGFEVSIKREDLSGCTLSGNKVRKLEFLLADALEQGCDTVITYGAFQSNHARATAMAARELGMEPYVFVLDITPGFENPTELSSQGNCLLMRLVGTNFVVYPYDRNGSLEEQLDHVHKEMAKFAEKLSSEGHKAYTVPKGGSNPLGAWGWIDCFQEMIQQGLQNDFDDIFVPHGSGGSVCGLAIANYLTGSKLKIHAISINDRDSGPLLDHLRECLDYLGLADSVKAEDLLHPVFDYVSGGFGNPTEEEKQALIDVTSQTGVMLDLNFTVKCYLGMVGEMKKHPSVLKGKRALLIHTGGIYALFDGHIDGAMQKKPDCNRVTKSSDLFN